MAPETKFTIVDQEIGLLFALPAIQYIYENVPDIMGKSEVVFTLMQTVHVVYGGYQNFCLAERQKEEVTFRQIYDFIDQCMIGNEIDEIRRILDLFAQSKYVKSKPTVETEKKKNQVIPIGKILKDSVSENSGTTAVQAGGSISY